MNYSDFVLKKQERRYRLLIELWEATGRREHKTVDFMELAKRVGFASTGNIVDDSSASS